MFSAPVQAELAPDGSLGFPDLEILQTAEQLLIGSPKLLAIEYGTFSHDKLREQATKKNFSRRMVKNSELWVNPQAEGLSVAYVNEKILLLAKAATLKSEIARVADPKNRSYSPLLARGARYIKEDLWVVASHLPDPLASVFVPFDWEASAFEGSVSLWDGLHAVAAVERPDPIRAMDLADSIAMSLASRPAMAEGTEITTRDRSVLIRMDLDEQQLAESMQPPSDTAVASVEPIHTESPSAALPVTPTTSVPAAAMVKPQPRPFVPPAQSAHTPTTSSITLPDADVRSEFTTAPQGSPKQSNLPPAPPRPRVIKIVGLDGGPREILMDQPAH